MRKLVFLLPAFVVAGYFISPKEISTPVNSGVAILATSLSPATRGPATVAKDESYSFRKAVSVKFDFDSKTVDQNIAGQLYLNWDGNNVQASLKVADQPNDIYIRGEVTDRTLNCVSVPEQSSEGESDMVVLLKTLLLDYAYKTQRDENGDYVARFMGDTKIKLHYQQRKEFEVENSLHSISKNLISGDETIIVRMKDKSSHVRTSYSIQALKSKAPALTPRKMTECSNDFSILGKVIRKASASELRENLMQLNSSDRSLRQELARKILKNLRADETQLIDFMDWVHENLEDRQLSALAIGMLGNLGTPSAQSELVSLFSNVNEKTSHVQHQVLNAFTLIEKPLSGESRDFLKGQLTGGTSDLKEGAAYALGSSIQNNPKSPEARADLALLKNGLDSAGSARERIIFLDALNNSGSPEARPIIQKYTDSSDPQVRQKAQELLSM